MKKLFSIFILTFFLTTQLSATDLFVDAAVATGSIPNYYSNVNAAVTASVSGDRILIAEGTYATNPFTIDHSLEIMPMNAGTVVDLYNGSFTTGTAITISAPYAVVKLMDIKAGTLLVNNSSVALDLQVKNYSCNNLTINGSNAMQVAMDSITFSPGATVSIYGAVGMRFKLGHAVCGTVSITGANDFQCKISNGVCGTVYMTGANNFECLFSQMTCGSINSNSFSSTNTNRAKISIIDCTTPSVSFDYDNYDVTCIRSTVSGNTRFRFGSFVYSQTNNLYVLDEAGSNIMDSVNKIFIVASTVSGFLDYHNDNYKFVIANNLLRTVCIHAWNYRAFNTNRIINNEFVAGQYGNNTPKIMIATNNVPYYNMDFSNNVLPASTRYFFSGGYTNSPSNNYSSPFAIPGTFGYVGECQTEGTNDLTFPSQSTYISYYIVTFFYYAAFSNSNGDCIFPNRNATGVFKWTYNGYSISGSGPNPGVLLFPNVAGSPTNTVDAGNNGPEYTDIDLTRNDRGRLGGPYSILNYNPTNNPSNGKAFIYDLDIPTTLQPGTQPVNINAKAYHRD